MAPMRSIKLNDGNSIPILGFGTGTSQAFGDCSGVVTQSLGIGYRHLDCAWWYENQQHTGAAIAQAISASQNTISPLDSGHGSLEDVSSLELGREDLFITTKGGDFHADPESFNARTFLDQCLSDLGVEYVDLYLLHADILVQADVTVAWRQMEQIRREGLAKSIGVSNFSTKSLQAIIDNCEIVPAVNQIEFHPYSLAHYLPTLLPLCKEHNIVIECYAPLISITRHIGGPVDEAVAAVIKARVVEPMRASSTAAVDTEAAGSDRGGTMDTEETAAQILLMWAQQVSQGVVLTTTGKVDRMISQQVPFLQDSPIEPLSPTNIDLITQAGLQAPYRKFGQGWPFFMQGEGGIQACPVGSTHRNGPKDPLSKDHLK